MSDLTNLAGAKEEVSNSTWNVTFKNDGSSQSFDRGIRFLEFSDTVNDTAKLDCRVEGVDSSIVDKGSRVELYKEDDLVWVGDVYDVSNKVGNEYMVECFGALKRLDRQATTREFYSSDVSSAVSGLVADKVDINFISDFQDVSNFVGSNGVDIGSEESNVLDALARLCEEIGADFYMTNVEYFEESEAAPSASNTANLISFDVTMNTDGIIKRVGFEPDSTGEYKVEIQDGSGSTIVTRQRSSYNSGTWMYVKFTREDYASVLSSGETATVIVSAVDSSNNIYNDVASGSNTLFDYSSNVPTQNNSGGGDFVTVRDTASTSETEAGVSSEVRPALNVVVPSTANTVAKDYYLTKDDSNRNNIADLDVTDRGGEQFDQVVVKPEGSGSILRLASGDNAVVRYPDPSEPGDPALPADPDTYVFEGKAVGTFENRDMMRLLAKKLYEKRNQEWEEVSLIPTDTQFIHLLEDTIHITDTSSDDVIDSDFRVVGRRYVFDPLDLQYDESSKYYSEILCSNKPDDFARDSAHTVRRFRDFASYSQSTRGVINQNDSEVVDSSGSLDFSFQIPPRFVEDRAGRDRTIEARLDVSANKYAEIIDPSTTSTVSVIDESTSSYDTTVTNFGNVARDRTEQLADNVADTAAATDTSGGGGGSVSNTGYSVNVDVSYVDTWDTLIEFLDFPETADTIFDFEIKMNRTDYGATYGRVRMYRPSDGRTWPRNGYVERQFYPLVGSDFGADDAQAISGQIRVPVNLFNDDVYLQASFPQLDANGTDISESSGDLIANVYTESKGLHQHAFGGISNAVENATVKVQDTNGNRINASKDANQNSDTLPNTSTADPTQLQDSDIDYTKKSPNINEVEVYVNGVSIGTYSLGSNDTITDIDLLQDGDSDGDVELNTPGENTISVVPTDPTDAIGKLMGNVYIDHELKTNDL